MKYLYYPFLKIFKTKERKYFYEKNEDSRGSDKNKMNDKEIINVIIMLMKVSIRMRKNEASFENKILTVKQQQKGKEKKNRNTYKMKIKVRIQ